MTSSEGRTDRVPVGECPNHGYIFGDDVEWAFPNPAKCNDCGRDLYSAKLADESEVMALAE